MQPANLDLAARLHHLGDGGSCAPEGNANSVQTSLRMQALRSVSRWSLVSRRKAKANALTTYMDLIDMDTENSIKNAYIDAIKNAKHFLYIENQFFISYVEDSESKMTVQNEIAQAIYNRVVRAYREKKPFRVFIIIPLFPSMEGSPGDKKGGASIHKILHYTRLSLFKGRTALLPRLRLVVGDVDNYVSVCSLRNYQQWSDGRFVSHFSPICFSTNQCLGQVFIVQSQVL